MSEVAVLQLEKQMLKDALYDFLQVFEDSGAYGCIQTQWQDKPEWDEIRPRLDRALARAREGEG